MASDNSIFKPFLVYLAIFFITFVLCVLFFSLMSGSNYKSNEYIVNLNNEKLKYAYREKYNNKIVKEGYDFGNDYEEIIVNKNEKVYLNFAEYEIYDKNNLKVNGNFNSIINQECNTYKLVNNKATMKIKKNGKVLYTGPYVPDISKYINETGRYYVHIYIKRVENKNKINTDLSMTFIFRDMGDNNE